MTSDDKYFFPVIPLWFLINYFYFLLQILYFNLNHWINQSSCNRIFTRIRRINTLFPMINQELALWGRKKEEKKILKNRAKENFWFFLMCFFCIFHFFFMILRFVDHTNRIMRHKFLYLVQMNNLDVSHTILRSWINEVKQNAVKLIP